MCGRYYIDDDTAEELGKIVEELDRKHQMGQTQDIDVTESKRNLSTMRTGDICPSQSAKVILQKDNHWKFTESIWGYPKFTGSGLIINARAETVMEKRTFREDVMYRRCAIPASGFYEWDASKNKFQFTYGEKKLFFLAGIFSFYEEASRFVVLTTKANASMEKVHDRMPIVMDTDKMEQWIFHPEATEPILKKEPPMLTSTAEMEQLTLF